MNGSLRTFMVLETRLERINSGLQPNVFPIRLLKHMIVAETRLERINRVLQTRVLPIETTQPCERQMNGRYF